MMKKNPFTHAIIWFLSCCGACALGLCWSSVRVEARVHHDTCVQTKEKASTSRKKKRDKKTEPAAEKTDGLNLVPSLNMDEAIDSRMLGKRAKVSKKSKKKKNDKADNEPKKLSDVCETAAKVDLAEKIHVVKPGLFDPADKQNKAIASKKIKDKIKEADPTFHKRVCRETYSKDDEIDLLKKKDKVIQLETNGALDGVAKSVPVVKDADQDPLLLNKNKDKVKQDMMMHTTSQGMGMAHKKNVFGE